MPAYAKAILMGNLTRDPEVKFLASGKVVGDFSIAVNERYKKEDGTVIESVSYFDCQAWGKTAETIKQYLVKGNPIFVECRIKQESWEKEGVKKYAIRFVVERFQFIGTRQEGDAPARSSSPSSASSSQRPPQDDVPPVDTGDDIPF
jgi:single-strand DNA-binding protein